MNLKYKVSEDPQGLRVWFRVPGWKNAKSIRFPRGSKRRDIEAAVTRRVEEFKAQAAASAHPNKGGVAADVERYLELPQVQRLATLAERKMQLARFAEEFGNRDRLSITKQELETALGKWQRQEKWAAGTFNKYVTAIKHFYNALDDPEGRLPNPSRKLRRQAEPDPLPRAIPYEQIHAILDALGRRDTVPPEVDAEIRSLFQQGVTRVAIAARVGFSKETVGKVLMRHPAKPGDEQSLAAVRLRVIAFTGLRHGQVAKLRPEHYDRENRRLWVTGTKGTNHFWKPLDEQGIDAMDRFAAAGAWGEFDRKSLHRAWKTALKRLGLDPSLRPYDLRHSYLTEAYRASSDPFAVKALSGHRQLRTLERYTKAAVDPRAKAAVEAMSPALKRKVPTEMSPVPVTCKEKRKLRLVVSDGKEVG